MKQKTIFAILLLTGILIYPNFVLAKYDYYVDIDAKSGGNGNKDKPFKKIKDALDEGGKEIFIKKGIYNEEITLGKGVELKGEGVNSIIKGGIIMKDDSSIVNLKVDGGGVFIGSGDSVKLDSVKIVNSKIGVKTEGNGTLKILSSEISGNGKGMYIQKDKDIEISSSVIEDNDEEGIDIRQNVDGSISGNKIKNNRESGIEVIAGGSELKINNNSIQNNKSSGIAIQYYKMASKNGALRIFNNTISSNSNNGVTCKNPSGGSPGANYWTESIVMGANNIIGNKDGSFSSFCKFSDNTVYVATKTKEELEQEKIEKEKKEEIQKKEEGDEKNKIKEEQLKLEEEKRLDEERMQQEREQKISQINDIQQETEILYSAFLKKNEENNYLKTDIENRSRIITFFIGSDYKRLDKIAESVLIYDDEIYKLNNLKNQVNDQEVKDQIDKKISEISEKRNLFKEFIISEVNKFNLFGWFFGLFKRP